MKRNVLKTMIQTLSATKFVAACAVLTAATASFNAYAGGRVGWSVTVGSSYPAPVPVEVYPAPVVYPAPPVVYPAPPVMYPAPPVVYQPPPRVVYQPPQVIHPAPVVYGYPGYYGPPRHRRGHGHGYGHYRDYRDRGHGGYRY
jgi:hypothetical protein